MPENLTIVLVNMNQSKANISALLETSTANILLIQEPYWGQIIPACSDTDPEGETIHSTLNHPSWEVYNPPPSEEYPRVATFIRKEVTKMNLITIDPHFSSYYSITITITNTDTGHQIKLMNFYHHVTDHQPKLEFLLSTSIDQETLTILASDFNTHSYLWSPRDINESQWAPMLETWLDNKNLISTLPEGSITRSRNGNRDSCIDLMLVNQGYLSVL
jgi:Endonuclease-reverse transcriptase